jgi:hypothetical protein
MEILIIGFLERSSENAPDWEDVAKNILDQLRLKGFHHYTHTVGSNIVEIYVDNMTEFPAMMSKIKELNGLKSFFVHIDHLKEVSDAISNHEYFTAFSLCVSLYQSYAKQILISYIENKGLSFDTKKLDKLSLDSLIIMLYTNGLIADGIYSDMISVNRCRNNQIHFYLDKLLSEDTLKEIDDNIPKIIRSLEELKRKHEGKT